MLRLGAHGDAQELRDARLLEVAHQHGAAAQALVQLPSTAPRVAGEDEVRRRGQHLETQVGERPDQRLAAGDDAPALGLKPGFVGEGGDAAGDGEAVQRIGIEAVLDPVRASISPASPIAKPSRSPARARDLDSVCTTSRFG